MVIGIILIVLVIAFIVSRAFRNTPEHKGREGELHVHNILAQLPEDYTILDDVLLKTGNVTTQHHVVYDDQLLATIRSYSYPCLSDADVAQVVNRLTQQNVRDQVDDRTHVSNVYNSLRHLPPMRRHSRPPPRQIRQLLWLLQLPPLPLYYAVTLNNTD